MNAKSEMLAAEIRHHLNCYHEIVGEAVISSDERTFVAPVCGKCSMTVIAVGKNGALWRNRGN